MSDLVLAMALIAVVLLVSALASGIVERAPLSFPMIFLGLGFLLGAGGMGVIHIEPHSPILEAIGIVSLALVLFLDAVNIQVDELRSDWRIPMLSLGPGTILIILIIAVSAYLLIGTTPIQSLLLGAILSSTDPVVLRDVLRDERIPRSIRRALSVEAGMNDIVVLPIVLILIAILTASVGGMLEWALFLAKLLILSPLIGLAVGGIGAWLMGRADMRFGIRHEHQALYGIGLVLAAFVAGQAVQGDGFLAAFFAGLAVTLFNVSLCDCFLEYGEVTAEMAMLLAFVLFGALLSTLLGTIPLLPALLLALVVIVVARPLALALVLQRANMSNAARAFIGWFGPRGLSSLLLALLVVQANASGAEQLLAVTGVVVLVSVIAHGATATPLSAWYARRVAQETLAEEREATATGLFQHDAGETPRITPEELAARLMSASPPIVLDVRTRSQYDKDSGQIPGSARVPPDAVEAWAAKEAPARAVVAYCT
ncbi:MAG TPA: cation:proton antiporter [Roseiflexaceae bacterium]|nr:cation:proton antiporter [Roseiflexaceae bacterium]